MLRHFMRSGLASAAGGSTSFRGTGETLAALLSCISKAEVSQMLASNRGNSRSYSLRFGVEGLFEEGAVLTDLSRQPLGRATH